MALYTKSALGIFDPSNCGATWGLMLDGVGKFCFEHDITKFLFNGIIWQKVPDEERFIKVGHIDDYEVKFGG